MNATDTPTYQVRISHPSGVSHEQIQEFLDNGTVLQDLCLEQAIINSTQLYALGYQADSVEVGLATPPTRAPRCSFSSSPPSRSPMTSPR